MKKHTIKIAIGLALAAGAAQAAGPLYLTGEGEDLRPIKWDTSNGPIPVYVDGGEAFTFDFDGVTPFITIERANEITQFAFGQWNAVETSTFEAQVVGTIESVTPVEDATSQAVRAQYEANPYPRWMALPPLPETALGGGARGFLKRALPLAGPAVLPELPEHPSVLIAGCGTGRQARDIARRLPEAKITALDLSVSSLAYAKRKAEGAGVENVSFVQGDLLALTETGGAGFDMIFCSGVLHHLAEPEAGLAAITSRLKPGGVMKLALYSREARAFLKPAREKLAALGLCADAEGIRQARFALFNLPEGDPARAVTAWLDFYSLSDCRDALFHVQERDYHALELAEYLATQDLTFLGFQGLPRETAQAYRARFPQDPEARDLTNWAAFEPDHPLTFVAMYQFWVSR
ncbi:MAG: class I SAM-dependent methyltransferase [Limibacillus sp.]